MLRDKSLIELIKMLEKEQNQENINLIALEITYRIYVPFKDKTFEELLVENGYKIIDKEKIL